ncbi:MAG: ATP-binding protein, partial [Cardiobacteriaceae bacterium]|nr:ATP-binding protein [Cardiobacteriaceae bacterium]
FLSRPRRFGKSLLVTTLEAYFQGKKELFEGLEIEKLEQEWKKFPVLRFDLNAVKCTSPNDLQQLLDNILEKYEHLYDISSNSALLPGIRLKNLIRRARAQTGEKVVILIDEYDAPLLDTVVDDDNFQTMRTMLRSFYSPLKESGEHLRFVFLTGITKFSQLSIFSELNNLKIISMNDDYATICGITEDEISKYLHPEVEALAAKNAISYKNALLMLKNKYDGYHFSRNCPDIYNPYSLLNCLVDLEFNNYWFSSGTPTHLTEMLSQYRLRPEELDSISADIDSFDTPTETAETPIPVLYQSGYLTIKDYDCDGEYTLGFPNEEVRVGFLKGLMPYYTHLGSEENRSFIRTFNRALKNHDIESAMQEMKKFFAKIPYNAEKQDENHYKTVFYLVFTLITAFNTRTEQCTANGRIDLLVETRDAVFLFEFKLHGSAEEALAQIDEKGYAIQYEQGEKKLYKIGACFDEELRTLKSWVVRE